MDANMFKQLFQKSPKLFNRKEKPEKKDRPKIPKLIFVILALILLGLGLLVLFAKLWAHRTWPGLTMDELVFHLTRPIEGTGGGIFQSLALQVFLPVACIEAGAVTAAVLLRKKRPQVLRMVLPLESIAACLMIVFSVITFCKETDLMAYVAAQQSDSDFIENNYTDPATAALKFPEKKRNLIYIYLESMEMTYADQEDGGAFPENVIPELTELAEENLCFAGDSGQLNGGIVYPNSGYTMGAIFGQTSGLPLQTSLYNNMDTQDSFFPGINALGDILEKEGYRQVFQIGSDANFGGRELYMQDHGDYEIRDYNWAVDQGLIPADYFRFWGFEDEKLFSYAKDTLKELAAGDQPFNMTMLTVDTHFEDGYVCDLCEDTFGDNQYANVMACSSRQVADFVHWIQQQDFYENTTIIISGDHTTMDSDFCENVDPDYQRKTYVCIINPAAEVAQPEKERTFSTLDMFPTTLAALGVQIPGDKLGLGVNLFSARETLTESYGQEKMEEEMANHSDFLQEKANVTLTDALEDRTKNDLQAGFLIGVEPDTLDVTLQNIDFPADSAEVICSPDADKDSSRAITTAMDPVNNDEIANGFKADVRIPSSFGQEIHVWFVLHYDDDKTLLSNEYPVNLDELPAADPSDTVSSSVVSSSVIAESK
ncbi:MAG: LTA synthase family protein [Bilifractor sp.]